MNNSAYIGYSIATGTGPFSFMGFGHGGVPSWVSWVLGGLFLLAGVCGALANKDK